MMNAKFYLRLAAGKPVLGSLVMRKKMPGNGTWIELSSHTLGVCCGFNPPALPSPANFTVTTGSVTNSLSWSSVSGADSYKLERSTAADFSANLTTVYNSTGSSYSDTAVTAGVHYYYRITAVSTGRDKLSSAFGYADIVTTT